MQDTSQSVADFTTLSDTDCTAIAGEWRSEMDSMVVYDDCLWDRGDGSKTTQLIIQELRSDGSYKGAFAPADPTKMGSDALYIYPAGVPSYGLAEYGSEEEIESGDMTKDRIFMTQQNLSAEDVEKELYYRQ
jgi:hypothetical protein